MVPHFLVRDKIDVIVFIFALVAFIVCGVVLFTSPHRYIVRIDFKVSIESRKKSQEEKER